MALFPGFVCGRNDEPVSAALAEKAIDGGVVALWLPVFNHANTMHIVGSRRELIEHDMNAQGWMGPCPGRRRWSTAATTSTSPAS